MVRITTSPPYPSVSIRIRYGLLIPVVESYIVYETIVYKDYRGKTRFREWGYSLLSFFLKERRGNAYYADNVLNS